MTEDFSDEAMRVSMRAHCISLCDSSPGWHPYILDMAEKAQLENSAHAGLVAEVETHIGPDAKAAARAALKYFRKVPS